MPIKANYRFIDSDTTFMEIQKGEAKVLMNGHIKYFVDEDGDLGMSLLDKTNPNRVIRDKYIAMNKKIEAYTLMV